VLGRPAWTRPVRLVMALGAPLRQAKRRSAGDLASVGGDEMAAARKRPADLHGAGRPGAAHPRAMLFPACSLLVLAPSCTST
jgi:hypothetical protein